MNLLQLFFRLFGLKKNIANTGGKANTGAAGQDTYYTTTQQDIYPGHYPSNPQEYSSSPDNTTDNINSAAERIADAGTDNYSDNSSSDYSSDSSSSDSGSSDSGSSDSGGGYDSGGGGGWN